MNYAPDTLPRGYDWRNDGECRRPGHDPEMFFPGGTTGPWIPQIEDAKAVCRTCPVLRVCRQWAMEHRQESGIWGGMTEQDRVNERRREARARAAAETPMPVLRPNLTLAEVYAELTTAADGQGHIEWLGGTATTVGGACYSPNRLAWAATRGTPPVGSVVRYCDRPQCVAHIEDRVEREARKAQEQAPPAPKHGTAPDRHRPHAGYDPAHHKPRKVTPAQADEIYQLSNAGKSIQDLALKYGVSTQTIRKYAA